MMLTICTMTILMTSGTTRMQKIITMNTMTTEYFKQNLLTK